MPPLTCLIPAAGAGLRARPSTENLPKAMLRVAGKPILQHTIEMVRDQLDITKFRLVIGYKGEAIQNYFKDGKENGVTLDYIVNHELEKGLTWSIYCGRQGLTSPFLVILGDEYYQNTDHYRFKEITEADTLAVCGTMVPLNKEQIQQNYTVELQENNIQRLIEKPGKVVNNIMGVGTFLLSPEIFPLISQHYKNTNKPIDFISFLDSQCQNGSKLISHKLKGKYVNVNSASALELANRLAVGT